MADLLAVTRQEVEEMRKSLDCGLMEAQFRAQQAKALALVRAQHQNEAIKQVLEWLIKRA